MSQSAVVDPGIAELVASGHIEIPIAAAYPLERVGEAYAELEKRHTHGKIVLVPSFSRHRASHPSTSKSATG